MTRADPRPRPHRPRRAADAVRAGEPRTSSSTCSGWRSRTAEGSRSILRGWGDYQRYSLKLTESTLPGIGHMAIRAWSPEALERRVAAIEQTGLGIGWIDGDHGHGPAYQFTDPDGHAFELYYETDRYEPPDASAAGAEERPAALHRPWRRGQAARPRQPARPGRRRRTARSRRSSSASACTSRSSTTTAASRAPG